MFGRVQTERRAWNLSVQARLSQEVPHQVAGGEEGVSTVQHACSATGPAGGQHGHLRAHTAASARDRECGVADENPQRALPRPAPLPFCRPLQSQAPTHLLSSRLCGYWLVESVDRQQEEKNAQIFTTTTTTTTHYAFAPLCSSHWFTREG